MKRAVTSGVLAACAFSRVAFAQSDCQQRWEAVAKTKAALTDCLRSGKSCKAEFAASDAARAAAGPCGEAPAEVTEETIPPDGSPPKPVATPVVSPWTTVADPRPPAARAIATPNPSATEEGSLRVGVGFGLASGRALTLNATSAIRVPEGPLTVRVPMLGSRMRFEPELGFDRDGQKSSLGSASITAITTTFRMTLGVHWLSRRDGDATIVYFGPRLGFSNVTTSFVESDSTGDTNDNGYRNDLIASLGLGGEHFLSRRFSVGGEAALVTTYMLSASVTGGSDVKNEGNSLSTQASVLMRWYF